MPTFGMQVYMQVEDSYIKEILKKCLPIFIKFCFFYLFIYLFLFNAYEYTVDIFRRGQQIPLQMVVSHHVVAGN
jgi:hypothetical protein